jgi:outer membrane protein OmpA-like peptidoglycan-associated protein
MIDWLAVRVHFDLDKFILRKEDVAELDKVVAFAKRYPGYRMSIEGHTDSPASEASNQGLSERRAAAVKDYLLKHGVPYGNGMTTVGYGELRPIADNATPQGRFQNRLVEILIAREE